MTLTTHTLVGASIAQLFPTHPGLAFAVGFASHFLLDAIPHQDYNLQSFKKNEGDTLKSYFIYDKRFLFDLFKIGGDFFLGFLLVGIIYLLWIPGGFWLATLAGVIGAIFPDALHFVYFNFRHEPLTTIERIHFKINEKRHEFASLSYFSQAVVGLIFVIIVFGFY